MFIGEAGAGKSTLLGALMNQPLATEAQSTFMADAKEVKCQWIATKDGANWCDVTEENEIEELAVLAKKVMKIDPEGSGKLLTTTNEATAVKIFNPTESPLPESYQLSNNSFAQDAEKVLSEIITKAQALIDTPSAHQNDQYINLWDCGGQRVFLDVLPAFLTSRTMFFLVFDASKDLQDKVTVIWNQKGKSTQLETLNLSRKDLLVQWMSCINATLTKRAEQFYKAQHPECNDVIDPPFPRIVIIGTHGDVLDVPNKEGIHSKLESEYEGKPFIDQVTDTIILDSTKQGKEEDPELKKVKSIVTEFISDALCLPTPIAWVLFRKLFRKLTTQRPVVSLANVAIISRACSIDDSTLLSVLAFYHELGAFLHYADISSLRDIVIAQPKWLIKHLGTILAPEQSGNRRKGRMSAWKFLHAQGILVEALYDELWKTDFPDCEVKPQVFADLLDHFLLIAEIRQTSIPIPSTHGKTYFMPCVLPICPDDAVVALPDAVLTAAPLHLTFSSMYVPPGYFVRLATVLCSTTGFTIDFKRGVYSNSIIFQYGEDGQNGRIDDIQISATHFSICVDISRRSHCDYVASYNFSSTCRSVFKVLLAAIHKLHLWFQSVKVKAEFTCEQCKGRPIHCAPISLETESVTSLRCEFGAVWKSTADQQFWLKIPTIPDNLEGVLYEDEIKVLLQEINEEEFVKLSKALEMKQSASECFDDKVLNVCHWSREMGNLARSHLTYHLRRIGLHSQALRCCSDYYSKYKLTEQPGSISNQDQAHVNPLVTENDLVKCSGYIADDADLSTLAVRLGIPLDSTTDPQRYALGLLMQWRKQFKSHAYKETLINILSQCGKEFEKASRVLNGDGAEIPVLKTLMSSVGDKCAPDWYRLGLELDVPVSDLDIIQSDCLGRCHDGMLTMMGIWLKRCVNPTWKQIMIALQRMKNNLLAKCVEKEHLQ